MFRIGLVSVSFRSLDPSRVLELCRSCGLGAIEWGSDIHAPCDDTDKLSSIAELQLENGIACSSYGTYFRLGSDDTEALHSYINAAKLLRTDTLRLWCGTKNYTETDRSEREHILREAKRAASIAEEYGVTLCMECHSKTFTDRLDGALELMETVASPNFRMYWQPDQFRPLEENLKYAEGIAKYTRTIHVFNWHGKEKRPLAEAIEAWRQYLSRFDGSQTLLLEFMPDGRPEALPEEANALRRIIS